MQWWWCDEKRFTVQSDAGKRHVHVLHPNEAFTPRATHGAFGCNYMALVSQWGWLLVELEEYTSSNSYLRTMKEKCIPFMQDHTPTNQQILLVADNCAGHKQVEVTMFLQKEKVVQLPHPAQSPDLNIVEKLWGIMTNKLKAQPLAQSLGEFKAKIQEVWHQTCHTLDIESLVCSFVATCSTVVKQQGGNSATN